MSEMSVAEREASKVRLIGSGGMKPEEREEMRKRVVNQHPEFASYLSLDPRETKWAEKWRQDLENAALSEESEKIDPDVKRFVQVASEFFRGVAKKEGLVYKEEDLEIRIKLIEETSWLKIFPGNVAVAGFHSPAFRSIYLKYPEGKLENEHKLDLMDSIAHELRHRVARVALEKDVKNRILMPRTELGELLEEVFVMGYLLENLDAIPDAKFQELLTEKRTKMEKLGLEEDVLMVAYPEQDGDGYALGSYLNFIRIYKILKDKIPNLIDLCTKVRVGDRGARPRLVKAIVGGFGKKALAILMTGDTKDTEKAVSELIGQI